MQGGGNRASPTSPETKSPSSVARNCTTRATSSTAAARFNVPASVESNAVRSPSLPRIVYSSHRPDLVAPGAMAFTYPIIG
eukprot:SAG31_NODE_12994_length_901_cov_0.794264_1_plen_80_part_01